MFIPHLADYRKRITNQDQSRKAKLAWQKNRGRYRMGINRRERNRYKLGNVYQQVVKPVTSKTDFYKQGVYILKQEDYNAMNLADKILSICEQDVMGLPHANYSTSMTKGKHIYGMGLSQEEGEAEGYDEDEYYDEDDLEGELPELTDTENLEVALLSELEAEGVINVNVDPDDMGGYTISMMFETGDFLTFHLYADANSKPTMMAIAGEGVSDQVLMPINFIASDHSISIMDLQGFPFEFVKSMVKKYVGGEMGERLTERYLGKGVAIGKKVLKVIGGQKQKLEATRKRFRPLSQGMKQHLRTLARKRKGKKMKAPTLKKFRKSLKKREMLGLDKK